MSIHRFFVDNSFIKGNKVNITKEQARQLRLVLRLKKGDTILLIDEQGIEYLTELDVVSNDFATGIVIEKSQNTNEPTLKIALYQSLLHREKFETVLQKGTEVGVSYFIPIETEHSLPDSKVTTKDRLERWEKILKEAAEQSERGMVPTITEALSFSDAITEAVSFGPALIAWERNEETNPKFVIASIAKQSSENISIFIGPEGGFSKKEIEFAIEKGATPISLGKRILRSETAGPILSSILLYELDY